MTTNLYIDIHVIQAVPPACINRDDSGSPKSAMYGGVRRARVSSQAWKRATRAGFEGVLDTSDLGERTVHAVERIAAEIRNIDTRVSEEEALELATTVLTAAGIKAKPKKTKKDEEPGAPVTDYLIFLAKRQIQGAAEVALTARNTETAIDKKAAKQALLDDTAIDVALFGRMIADSPDLNTDACCQVAHALSVHAAATEFDYFTAVDDNKADDNAGATMIGTVEFVSSTLYRYATINAGKLSDTLDSTEAARRAIQAFIRSFVLSMPTGKQNTFANRTRPELVLVSVRNDQPVSFVDAYETAISSDSGYTEAAAIALAKHAIESDAVYGTTPLMSFYLATGSAATAAAKKELDTYAQAHTLEEICRAAADALDDKELGK